jgi:hypothetical protein
VLFGIGEKRENGANGREEGVRKKGDQRFLISPIRPILLLLLVLVLQKCIAMLRCQINGKRKQISKSPIMVYQSEVMFYFQTEHK